MLLILKYQFHNSSNLCHIYCLSHTVLLNYWVEEETNSYASNSKQGSILRKIESNYLFGVICEYLIWNSGNIVVDFFLYLFNIARLNKVDCRYI